MLIEPSHEDIARDTEDTANAGPALEALVTLMVVIEDELPVCSTADLASPINSCDHLVKARLADCAVCIALCAILANYTPKSAATSPRLSHPRLSALGMLHLGILLR